MTIIYISIAFILGFNVAIAIAAVRRYNRQKLINKIVDDMIGGNMTLETQMMLDKIQRIASQSGLHVNLRKENLINLYNSIGDEIEIFQSKMYNNSFLIDIKLGNGNTCNLSFDNDQSVTTFEMAVKRALSKYDNLRTQKTQ